MSTSRPRTRQSGAKSRSSAISDRVEAYIDSPLVSHRVRFDRQLSARIQGNYGIYRTWVRIASRGLDSGCTCPSDWQPCKHVSALELTWRENPKSFFDVEGFVKTLASRPKTELIDIIGKLITRAPEGLATLGVKGFDAQDGEDGEDSEW